MTIPPLVLGVFLIVLVFLQGLCIWAVTDRNLLSSASVDPKRRAWKRVLVLFSFAALLFVFNVVCDNVAKSLDGADGVLGYFNSFSDALKQIMTALLTATILKVFTTEPDEVPTAKERALDTANTP